VVRTHKDLEVWKNSIKLVTDVYKISEGFPKCEVFGLMSQIRRAAVSIPSNIAEGAARSHDKEFIQFLYISIGSLSEVETQLIIAQNIGYIDSEEFNRINGQMNLIRSQILGLINHINTKKL